MKVIARLANNFVAISSLAFTMHVTWPLSNPTEKIKGRAKFLVSALPGNDVTFAGKSEGKNMHKCTWETSNERHAELMEQQETQYRFSVSRLTLKGMYPMKTHTTLMKNTFSVLVLTALVIPAVERRADAAPLAQESFAYNPSDVPGNGAAGAGWAGGWGGQNDHDVVAGGLSYPDYPSAGNRVVPTSGSFKATNRKLDVAGTFGAYLENNGNGDVIGADGTEIWTSFLMRGRPRQGHATNRGHWVSTSDGDAGNQSRDTNIGYFWKINGSNSSSYEWTLFGIDATNGATSDFDYSGIPADDNTHLFLARYTFGAANADTVDVFLDPDAAGDPTTFTPTMTLGIDDASFHTIEYRMSAAMTDAADLPFVAWDEFQIGATVFDVLPNAIRPEPPATGTAPEPSTFLLAALGVCVLGLRRRRRRRR